MFVRNLLQAGDHVTIIPSGVPLTLQYGENGNVENVYVGHKNDAVVHSELLPMLLTSSEIPSRISVTKGTTFVYGCLYTGEMYKVEGRLDSAVASVYLSKYIEDPSKFHFFAGHMQSYALGMTAPLAIQRWLSTTGFKTLPSYLVPSTLNEDNFSSMIRQDSYPFVFPRIQGYVVFRAGEHLFLSTNVRQLVVKQLEKSVSYEGYVLAEIQGYDLSPITVSYADVINFNIHKDSILLLNEDNQIVNCYNFPGLSHNTYDRKIVCTYCGRLIDVPTSSKKFTCENDHCISVIHLRVTRMLSKLGLPPIELVNLKEYSKQMNNILTLPDVLDMEEYKDVLIEIDLPKLLDAVVPSSVISRISDWYIFCNRCNNSIESVSYYLQNPNMLLKDLNLEPAIYRRLCMWLNDPENIVDVIGMIQCPHVKVISTGKRFEGAPIFRNKSIYVTGSFMHGSFEDIKAILTSYSALVYDKFNTAVDCVIIGGLHENIDSKSIQKARQMNIPIFEETEFFSKYEIDNDLNATNV